MHRNLIEHPHFKDPEWVSVWLFILLSAGFKRKTVHFDGASLSIPAGSFVSSRREIAHFTGISEAKVWRIIQTMKSADQIAIQQGAKKAVFTVLNWKTYQNVKDQIEDQVKTK